MKSDWGILGLLAALAVGVVPATGCTVVACPAIGYVRTLTVHIEGNIAAVSDVKLCDETRCSEPEPTAGTPVPMKTVVTEFSPEPQPTVTYPPFHSRREDQDTWVFTVSSGDPAKVTVRALAADGGVLAEREQELVWTRVGGTEQCGGPVTAPPVLLSVP